MYIVVNETKSTSTAIEGDFPLQYLNTLYKEGYSFYIISLYSMCIKIPISTNMDTVVGKQIYPELHDEFDVKFKEYPLPIELIKEEYLINMGK